MTVQHKICESLEKITAILMGEGSLDERLERARMDLDIARSAAKRENHKSQHILDGIMTVMGPPGSAHNLGPVDRMDIVHKIRNLYSDLECC